MNRAGISNIVLHNVLIIAICASLSGCAEGSDLAVMEMGLLVTVPVWGPPVLIAKGIGKLTDNPTKGMSSETTAVYEGPDAIQEFVKNGGVFTDDYDVNGRTSAMMAVERGPDTIRAFAAAGGRFTAVCDKSGDDVQMLAAQEEPETIRAFAQSGGVFTDHQNINGNTSAMLAARKGVNSINAYAAAGGVFTDQRNNLNQTARSYVLGEDEIAAYDRAVTNQGGLRHVESKKEKAS